MWRHRSTHRFMIILLPVVQLLSRTSSATAERQEKCFLPLAEGACNEQRLSWYYNNETGLCQTFLYTGCGGNANNFNSSMYCLHACNATTGELHSYSIGKATAEIKGNPSAATAASIKQAEPEPASVASASSGDVTSRESAATPAAAEKRQEELLSQKSQDHQQPSGESKDRPKRQTSAELISSTDGTSGKLTDDIATLKEMVVQLSRSVNDLQQVSATALGSQAQGHQGQRRHGQGHQSHGHYPSSRPQKKHTSTQDVEVSRVNSVPAPREAVLEGVATQAAEGEELKPLTSPAARRKKVKKTGRRKNKVVTVSGAKTQRHHSESPALSYQAHVKEEAAAREAKATAKGNEIKERKGEERNTENIAKVEKIIIGKAQPSSSLNKDGSKDDDDGDDEDNDLEVISDKVSAIIADPSYAFSCRNISADDLRTLNEMASQSDFGALQLQTESTDAEVTTKEKGDKKASKVTGGVEHSSSAMGEVTTNQRQGAGLVGTLVAPPTTSGTQGKEHA